MSLDTQQERPIALGVLYGSTREGRLCDHVAGWAQARIAAHGGFSADAIDPARMALPAHHGLPSSAVDALRARIAAADAFVVVVPEYNHGYPAAIKQVIDSAWREWHAKPVAFVGYGGASGGLRAIEQLRQVFAGLHAVGMHDSVCIVGAPRRFALGGNLADDARPRQAMTAMLAQLQWWSRALRAARQAVPYERAVA